MSRLFYSSEIFIWADSCHMQCVTYVIAYGRTPCLCIHVIFHLKSDFGVFVFPSALNSVFSFNFHWHTRIIMVESDRECVTTFQFIFQFRHFTAFLHYSGNNKSNDKIEMRPNQIGSKCRVECVRKLNLATSVCVRACVYFAFTHGVKIGVNLDANLNFQNKTMK